MTKTAGRRHRRGMLTSMVKYPKSSQHKKRSLLGTIGLWAGGIVLGGVLLAMAIGLLAALFNPKVGQRQGEADFTVENILENPPGYPAEDKIVAAAEVFIENLRTRVPLTAATRAGVEKGSILHIRYEYLPRMGVARILDWRLQNGGETAK